MWILWVFDFNPTNNFIRILNFNYSFDISNLNVSYYNSCKFINTPNTSKPEINSSNENIILIAVFTSSFFHLLIKENLM